VLALCKGLLRKTPSLAVAETAKSRNPRVRSIARTGHRNHEDGLPLLCLACSAFAKDCWQIP
jgi:hypothetical protein